MTEIEGHFGEKVTLPVPVNVAVDEASAPGRPVVDYAPRSRGAQAFEKIALEMLQDA